MINFTSMRDDLREQLRLELYAKRISITALANELDMSRVNLSRMLNGQMDGRFEIWEKVAAKVGMQFMLTKVSEDK